MRGSEVSTSVVKRSEV